MYLQDLLRTQGLPRAINFSFQYMARLNKRHYPGPENLPPYHPAQKALNICTWSNMSSLPILAVTNNGHNSLVGVAGDTHMLAIQRLIEVRHLSITLTILTLLNHVRTCTSNWPE